MEGKILVVEDDPAIRMLIEAVLAGNGHAVVTASDGPSAVPTARAERPDVILLDIGLPGMDGFGVLGLLKDDAELRDIPVLMVTAWAEPELVARALDHGAHDYLRKPFANVELAARVDAALRVKVQTDSLLSDQERLTALAGHDALTALPNRRHLTEVLERQALAGRRVGRPFSVIVLDVDNFSAINETHGHEVGDEALRAVAKRLRLRARASDVIGRWGGEEFLVVSPGNGLGGAGALAEDLRVALAERPLDTGTEMVALTASFGVAEFDRAERPCMTPSAVGATRCGWLRRSMRAPLRRICGPSRNRPLTEGEVLRAGCVSRKAGRATGRSRRRGSGPSRGGC
jgi:diguanylate cyclase (GGDEF)-like protein